MKVRVGAASDIGRARQRNEDAFLTAPPVYVVADGMGGHRGGEVASAIAIDVVAKTSAEPLPERIRDANRAVFDRQAGDRSVAGMGTTVTAVEIDGRSVRLAHVGDSRAYLLRDGQLRMLTEDHTLVQQMVDEGKISASDAHDHPQRNILTRVVGVDPEVEVDEESLDVREGDRILLCSDGLTSMMRDESIHEILDGHADPQEAADALIDSANRAGGLDNITVVVLDFGAGDGVELLGPSGDSSAGRADVGAASPAARIAEPSSATSTTREEPPLPARRHPQPDETGMLEPVGPQRKRWRRVVIWIGVALVLIAGGLTAFRMYLDSQWYVGVSNGHVAVFRGSPGDLLGFGLSSVVSETDIPAKDAESFAPYRQLPDGLTVGSRSKAVALVGEIRQTIKQAQQKPPARKKASG